MSDHTIIYKSYIEGSASLLDREVLDAEGIPYFITTDSLMTVYPVAGQNFGAIQLHIYEADLERVNRVLAHAYEAPIEDNGLFTEDTQREEEEQ